MPPQVPVTPTPQPMPLLTYVTIIVIMLAITAVGLVGWLIYEKFVYPKQARAKKIEKARRQIMDRHYDRQETLAFERLVAAQLQEDDSKFMARRQIQLQNELDDTIIVPFVTKEYHNGL